MEDLDFESDFMEDSDFEAFEVEDADWADLTNDYRYNLLVKDQLVKRASEMAANYPDELAPLVFAGYGLLQSGHHFTALIQSRKAAKEWFDSF